MSNPEPPNVPAGIGRERRSPRKRRAVLEAAPTVFLDNRYLGMDEIETLAGVSKQTIYKPLADKEILVCEIVTSTIDEVTEPFHNDVLDPEDSGDVNAFHDRARRLLIVMQPRLRQLRRLVIGEAGRFPDLGRTYHQRGPERAIAALATAFRSARLAERGERQLDDPLLAAAHFSC